MNGPSSAAQHARFIGLRRHVRHLPQQGTRSLDPAEASEVLLVLDARGRIQYCGNRNSFLHNNEEMTGKPISALIPDLPLHEGTPGYNIAYVRFAFANERWQRHVAAAADAILWPVDIFLRTVSIEGGYSLIGLLRLPGDAAAPDVVRTNTATGDAASGTWRIDALAATSATCALR